MEVVIAHDGVEVGGVVELLLGAVREAAAEAARAAVLVVRAAVRALPVRAHLRAVANARVAAQVLVVVRVDALLPVVEGADGAPQRLVRPHEEVRGDALQALLRLRAHGTQDLLAGVRIRAALPLLALAHAREGRAEAVLPQAPGPRGDLLIVP